MKTEYVNERSAADDGCRMRTLQIGAVVFALCRLTMLAVRRARR